MSQENVEVVRKVYAEWARGNVSAGVEMFHPEIAFETYMPDAREEVIACGPDEIETHMREFLSQWDNWRLIGDDFRDAGDRVFVAGRHKARGRQSGVEVEEPIFSVWTFRAEKVVGLQFLNSRANALEAAGLSE
ncbi:MAG: nuclear transport factor 2 family protein [Solirubrobacterales bacterium]